jgi:DNA repair exonuclease SbcCD ATPase subunit
MTPSNTTQTGPFPVGLTAVPANNRDMSTGIKDPQSEERITEWEKQLKNADEIHADVWMEFVGGLIEGSADFSSGLSVLAGGNATGRSSFIQGMTAVLGGRNPTINSNLGSDGTARIELTRSLPGTAYENETVVREYENTADSSRQTVSENRFPVDEETVNTFVAIDRQNPLRQAILNGHEHQLRDLLMQPLDENELEAKIQKLKKEIRELEQENDEKERKRNTIERLEQQKNHLDDEIVDIEDQIEKKEQKLQAVQREISEVEADSSEQADDELEEEIERLERQQSQLQTEQTDLNRDLKNNRETVEVWEDELDELRNDIYTQYTEIVEIFSETNMLTSLVYIDRPTDEDEFIENSIPWEDLPEPEEAVQDLKANIQTDKTKSEDLEDKKDALRRVKTFIENDLSDEYIEAMKTGQTLAPDTTDSEDTHRHVSEKLIDAGDRRCVICGSEVTENDIASQKEKIDDLMYWLTTNQNEIDQRVSEKQEQIETIRTAVEDLNQMKQKIRAKKGRIAEFEDDISASEDRLDEIADEIAEIESEIEQYRKQKDEKLRDLFEKRDEIQKEIGSLESDREYRENELAGIESQITETEELKESIEENKNKIGELKDRKDELRGRVRELEKRVVEQFNNSMDELVALLEYDNIARVWIERKTSDDSKSADQFELHLVRDTQNGTAETTIDTFSESERTMVGITAAVAGYTAHTLSEKIPFILLDSLEAFDGHRLNKLLDYVSDRNIITIAALLPEDEAAIDTECSMIDAFNWTVTA